MVLEGRGDKEPMRALEGQSGRMHISPQASFELSQPHVCYQVQLQDRVKEKVRLAVLG